MKIKKCRNCRSSNLINLFDLGNISFSGKFSKKPGTIKKGHLGIVICKKCKLVQLSENFNLKYLYGPDYGYRTGINQTMVSHVKSLVKDLSKKTKLKKNEAVLDIASNDGTLLNFYSSNITTFGIDPLIKKYNNFYKKVNYKVANFFEYKAVTKKYKSKFKIITALSVFYDLQDPNKFLSGIEKLLDRNGLAVIELADLESIIKYKMFDTICHEHLEYYSTNVLVEMFKKNNLKLIDIKSNKINGSSKQYYICKNQSDYNVNLKKINKVIKDEKKLSLEDPKTYLNFKKKIDHIKLTLVNTIKKIKKSGKSIHGYGASTKGNVLLQYFGIGKKMLDFVAERNPKKYGFHTPGTNIKIVSEKQSRKLKPSYYLVLPWHFKREIIKREKQTINSGSSFIFPLPKLSIISKI